MSQTGEPLLSVIGKSWPKVDAWAKVTGETRFADDLVLPRMAYAKVLRAPHPHALIRGIDTRRAAALPGVYAVITGDDVAQLTRPQRGRVPLPNSPKVYALAYQQVRYVGEPVVGIAAVDRATAEDAADLIRVEYDPLPPVLDPEEALRADAPLVFEEVGSNILWHNTFPYGDVDGAFAQADTVVNERVTIHRYSSTPLETFGVMAQFEAATQSYTIWGHTQQPAQDLHVLAAALDVSPGEIRMIVPPMGGSFGNKVRPLFIIAVALLARKAGRPVKWIEDRRESLLALGHAADGIMEMSAAVKTDGTVLAIKFRNIENEGAGIDFAARHNLLMLSNIANCYRFRALSYEGYSVVTNRCPVVANRGIGKPFMCFSVERMIDAVARKLKIDRSEIRFRNFIQPDQFPFRNTPRYDLEEAYGSYAIPLGNGLTVKAGKFVTLLGYEVIEAPNNLTFSRSFLFSLAIPLTHVGALVTYPVFDWLSLTAGPVVGWDIGDDNNGTPGRPTLKRRQPTAPDGTTPDGTTAPSDQKPNDPPKLKRNTGDTSSDPSSTTQPKTTP